MTIDCDDEYTKLNAIYDNIESKLTWEMDMKLGWILYYENNPIARVFTVFLPMRGIDGWFHCLKGKRKPWLKRYGFCFSTAGHAKGHIQYLIVRRMVNKILNNE